MGFQRRPTWPSSKQLTDKTSISKNTRKRDRDGKKRGRARTICCFILLHAICSSNFEENSRKKKKKRNNTHQNKSASFASFWFSFSSRETRKKTTKWAISQLFLPASLECSKDCDHIV